MTELVQEYGYYSSGENPLPLPTPTNMDYGDDWQGTRCARCRMGGCPRAR